MDRSRTVSTRRLTTLISGLVFLDMITWLAAVPLVPVWQSEYGLTDDQAGIVLGAYAFSVLFAAIPAGIVSDRVGARRTMLVGSAAFILAAPAFALADTFWLLILVRVVQGACSAVTWSAGLAWLAGAVREDERPRALSIVNAAATTGTIAGPLVGGPVVSAFGVTATFLAVGGLIALGVVWALVEPGGAPDVGRHHEPQRPLEALHRATHRGRLQMAYVSIGFIALMMAALQLLAPLHLDAAGLSSAGIGWVFTVGSVLSVAAILAVGRLGRRIDPVRTLLLLPIVCGALVTLMIAPVGVAGYSALLMAVMCLSSPVFTIAYTACADGARDEGIGEGGAFALMNAIWAAGSVLSPVLAGFVSQRGPAWAMYVFVGAASVGAVLVLRRSRDAFGRVLGGSEAA